MSIWLFVWILLSGGLLFFMGWTLRILLRQKSAWKKFAQHYKLRYAPRSLMDTPELSGTIDDFTVNIFSGEHASADARSSRKLTAIEITLNSIMPVAGGIASGGMVPFLKDIGMREEYRPDHPAWNTEYLASSDNRFVLEAYLTEPRLNAFVNLAKIKNAWVILVFRDNLTLLRLDTPDPLDTPQKMNKIVKRMLEAAKIFELKSGESNILKTEKARTAQKKAALSISDDALESMDLELEDDDEAAPGEETGEETGEEDVQKDTAEEDSPEEKNEKGDARTPTTAP